MNKRLLTLLFTIFAITCSYAQQADPVVFSINGEPVYKSELTEAYNKSNELRPMDAKESIDDFVQSYIHFRMNLAEARAQQLDTLRSYITELSTARVETARKYMQNDRLDENYVKSMYKRTLEDVEINHVLVPFDSEIVFPADTLKTYNEAITLRNKILKSGFAGDGYKPRGSQWTSILIDNEKRNGYFGWISPFVLSSEVEDAVYSLPVGEISQPVRTAKGYHIVQVLNRRPTAGTAEVEQVVFGFPNIPPKQHQIDSVSKIAWREYKNIKSYADYKSLCDEFSMVHQTGDKGCYFGKVNLESMNPPSFIYAALSLEKEGDISEPVFSDYGFHIIRLLKKIPVPEYDVVRNELVAKLTGKGRVQNIGDIYRRNMFSRINISVNEGAYEQLTNLANTVYPQDSMFQKQVKNGDDILFTLDNRKSVKVSEFIDYITFRQSQLIPKDNDSYNLNKIVDAVKYSLSTDILREYFNAFLSRTTTDFYYNTLEDREPEYKSQIKDFSDGLLIFAVKNKNIWEKSETDISGLEKYFEANKSKYKLNGTRYKGMVLLAKNEDALQKAESLAKKTKDKNTFIQQLRQSINKDSITVLIEPGSWSKGNNSYVDFKIYGGPEPTPRNNFPFFTVVGEFISSPQDYTDVKNQVQADYQEMLENNWNKYLENKYKVEINKAVLKTIK